MSQDLDLTLSRRAVAAGWKFTPGQRVFAESLGHDDNAIIPDGYAGNAAEMAQLRPDFRDAATCGVLLQQVRERWGDAEAFCYPILRGQDWWGCVVWDKATAAERKFAAPSETAALLAALEAAPKR